MGEKKRGHTKRTKKATSKTQGKWLDRGESPALVPPWAKSASDFTLGGIFHLVSRAISMVGFPNHLISVTEQTQKHPLFYIYLAVF